MLRPKRCWSDTADMASLASRPPTISPKAPSATPASHSLPPAPTPSRVRHTSGWTTRSTARGEVRLTTHSIEIEPAPASTGTAARNTGSRPSLIPYCFWIAGIRVTSSAKTAPCTR